MSIINVFLSISLSICRSIHPSVYPHGTLDTSDAPHAKPSTPQPYSVQRAPTLALAACAHPRCPHTRPHSGRRAGTPSATRCRSWTRVRTGCSSLPRFSAHVCAGTRPHPRWDSPTSAPGCAAAGVGRGDDGRARPRARHRRRHAGKKSRARCGGGCDAIYSPAMLSIAL